MLVLPGGRVRADALELILDEHWPVMRYEPIRHRMRYALSGRRSHQAMMLIGELTVTGGRDTPGRAARLAFVAARRWLRARHPQRDRAPRG